MIKVGSIVIHSNYALEDLRVRMQGGFSQQSRDMAKRQYNKRLADRGEVVAVIDRGSYLSSAYRVRWSDGTHSECLDYMVAESR